MLVPSRAHHRPAPWVTPSRRFVHPLDLYRLFFAIEQCSFGLPSSVFEQRSINGITPEGFLTCEHLRLRAWSGTEGLKPPTKLSGPKASRVFEDQRSGGWGRGGQTTPCWKMIKDQHGTGLMLTNGEVTCACACEEGSRFRERPGGLALPSDGLGDNRRQPPAQARSAQRRDLRPAVAQAGGGGAVRAVQSGEPPEPYVRATRRGRRGRRGLCAVAAVRPSLAPAGAVLRGFGRFRRVLGRRDLRWPRQPDGGRPGTPETERW